MKADKKLIEAYEDLTSEAEVMAKLGYTKDGLYKLRKSGQIKNWRSINGKKIMYSKTELAKLLNLQTMKPLINHFTQPFTDDVPVGVLYIALLIVTIIIGGFLAAKRKDQKTAL
jgi:hypothetical protein